MLALAAYLHPLLTILDTLGQLLSAAKVLTPQGGL
jgi:hypothetical protein